MRFTICIPILLLMTASLTCVGCQSSTQKSKSFQHSISGLNETLVLPGSGLVKAWPSEAAARLNHRRNAVLGADRLPYAPAVNAASVRVWDQQWILNGRSMDTYVRTTRSLQSQELP